MKKETVLEEDIFVEGEHLCTKQVVVAHIKHLQAKVLEITEVAFPPGEQLNAVKRTVKGLFNSKLNYIDELLEVGDDEEQGVVSYHNEEGLL